ncbi:MAG: ribonuclease D [Roseovarius sp.]|nr:ribonuclease D [Roseovarius sp.]MCY4207203.1 ribonuclease D [Roseovarius sp.]MCY4290448.1 ribonuclease D [Roseovarius sp.]MCY4317001.1 ribonuclease D [Roseovarius sp.]
MSDNRFFKNDLPDGIDLGSEVAIDCETMGLDPNRDRLCLVQLSDGDGNVCFIQIGPGQMEAPNLCALLASPDILKLFHFGRFDIAILYHTFKVLCSPVYCTKIASKLARTYTDRHGLKDLLKEVLGLDIAKHLQSSDWGSPDLTPAQLEYAASDVIYLHRLKRELDIRLKREGRAALAEACFGFLPERAILDISGWRDVDIFAH